MFNSERCQLEARGAFFSECCKEQARTSERSEAMAVGAFSSGCCKVKPPASEGCVVVVVSTLSSDAAMKRQLEHSLLNGVR